MKKKKSRCPWMSSHIEINWIIIYISKFLNTYNKVVIKIEIISLFQNLAEKFNMSKTNTRKNII